MVTSVNGGKSPREEVSPIDLQTTLENFGPITSGNIALKPLTLFVGPNNSGKSYAAMLMHSIFESVIPNLPMRFRFSRHWRMSFLGGDLDIRKMTKEFPEFQNFLKDFKEKDELEFPPELIQKVTQKVLSIFSKRLDEEIVRAFASQLNDLRKIHENTFSINTNFTHSNVNLDLKKNHLMLKDCNVSLFKIIFKKVNIGLNEIVRMEQKNGNELLIQFNKDQMFKDKDFWPLIGLHSVIEACASYIFQGVNVTCFYLPAARSGILVSHKALAASIVKRAPLGGVERLEIPKFSGVVADLISYILNLPDKKGPFYQLAKDFEEELINGEIVAKTSDESIQEITFRFKNTEIPLHRTSSTVSEVAPLMLYLKYIVVPGSLLIIEEPEAHLHPRNQLILAKYLVKLIRNKVNILITTHSEYLLEQLNNFLMLNKIDPKKREKKYKYSEDDFLKPDEIAAYVFNFDPKSNGHIIKSVEIDEEDGISGEEFLKIHEALYEETIRLRKDSISEEAS